MITNEIEIARRLNELWRKGEPGFTTPFDCNLLYASEAMVDPKSFDITVYLRQAHEETATRAMSLERCLNELEGFRAHYNDVVNEKLGAPSAPVPPAAVFNQSSNPLFGSW